MSQLRRSAAHEAGHLTFAIVLDWKIDGASVNGGDQEIGGVYAVPPRNEFEMTNDIPADGDWRAVVTEYENVILQHAAGAAGEQIVFGDYCGEGSPRDERSDWGLVVYLLEQWGEDLDRPTLRFGEAAPFSVAVEAAQAWLLVESHLRLFNELWGLLETQRSLTAAECSELRHTFLARIGSAPPP